MLSTKCSTKSMMKLEINTAVNRNSLFVTLYNTPCVSYSFNFNIPDISHFHVSQYKQVEPTPVKPRAFSDLLLSVADEIDYQYQNDTMLSSVQSVYDIQSIFTFGMLIPSLSEVICNDIACNHCNVQREN